MGPKSQEAYWSGVCLRRHKKVRLLLVLSHVRINFVVRFLPPFCADRVEVDEMPDQDSDAPAVDKSTKRPKNWKLDFASWLVAYDRLVSASSARCSALSPCT